LFGGLKNLDRMNIAPDLIPSNATQWGGYYFATAALIIVGLFLVAFGVRRAWHRPPH
jgi:hypothetical protein